jgi:hypothetical protein
MRTHTDIITDANGPHAVARLITPHVEADEVTVQKRVRAWVVSKSIPGEYWALLERLGVASMEELASEAASRKGVTLPANDTAASQEAA